MNNEELLIFEHARRCFREMGVPEHTDGTEFETTVYVEVCHQYPVQAMNVGKKRVHQIVCSAAAQLNDLA